MTMPPTIEFASLGMWDSLILMVMALVVFGPRRLPEIGRQIGKLMYEFRKASNDFKFQMEEELRSAEEADRRKKEEERLRALSLAPPATLAGEISPAVAPPTTLTGEIPPAAEAGPVASAAVVDAQLPAPSPYPGEESYPELATLATETAAPEAYPRIQPPSTGELVPAAPPNSLPAEPSSPAPEIVAPAPAVEETAPTAAELAYAEEWARQYEEAEAKRRAEAAPAPSPQQAEQTPSDPVNHHG